MAKRGIWGAREDTPGPEPEVRAVSEPGQQPVPPPAVSVDDELRARRETLARMEEEALREANSLKIRRDDLERFSESLDDRARNLQKESDELKRLKQVHLKELEEVAQLTVTQAKQILMAEVEQEARHQAGLKLREIDAETKREADRRARNILAIAMQRLAGEQATQNTTRMIDLPNEEMKGRIIGRDGRNIRSFERLTGVDVVIDETPTAIMLSSFDGVRREIARLTMEKLIADGRINPATIEETHEIAKRQIAERIIEEGEKAALDARVHGLDPKLIELLGQLRFRTSYGQNVLDHLVEASSLAAMMAAELGASVETARRATLLHDIGKAVSHEVEGPHALIGGKIVERHGESKAVAHAIEAHHNEVEPRTVEAVIVQAADALSGARPGARGEALEEYIGRLKDLEEIASRHPDVKQSYALRAGREIRVIVDPGRVDDDQAAIIAHQIATTVEKEMQYPGQIKITVIRETRATTFAS